MNRVISSYSRVKCYFGLFWFILVHFGLVRVSSGYFLVILGYFFPEKKPF